MNKDSKGTLIVYDTSNVDINDCYIVGIDPYTEEKTELQKAVEVLCNALSDGINDPQFYFEECKASNDCTHIYLLESELEQKHKDLLLGEVLHKFNNLPLELKKNFLNLLIQK